MQSILVLEDHKDTLEMLVSVVKEAFPECDVVTAANLAEARRMAGLHRFNLALVDLNLPDGSGVNFITELLSKQVDCYVVVATIYDDDKHLFDSLKAGALGYLLKDGHRNGLADALKAIIKGQPPLSPSIARRILRQFSQTTTPNPVSNSGLENSKNASPDATSHATIENEEEVLTSRELEVLSLVAKGFSRLEIADFLGITANTTASHVKNIYRKLNVGSRAEAALEARRLGLA
jgi:DNA-binding NarL/FixJ family response regulator